jgi:hypothetical protein
MASAQSPVRLTQTLAQAYDQYALPDITSRRFTQADMLRWLAPLQQNAGITEQEIGRSTEGRPLLLYSFGIGTTRALLWSQMHGDESTATMALMDMLHFFTAAPDHPVVRTIRQQLTVLMLPMLNPDGAERFQRRNAQQIDINRDALAVRTPEARALWSVRNRYAPEFGFNLHDQDPRYTVGASTRVTAISLLAPAVDPERTMTAGLLQAQHVASLVAQVCDILAPGHTARYDDTFEPRAFGDNIQKAGTSTVLIESGGWPNDPEKQFLRKLNFVALLAALHEIATGAYQQSPLSVYENLPFNGKNLYDIIVRNVLFQPDSSVAPIRVDVGINVDWKADAGGTARWMATVVDIGDLRTFGSFEERDGSSLRISGSTIVLDRSYPREDLENLLRAQ